MYTALLQIVGGDKLIIAKTAQNGVLAYLGFIVAMILSRNDA
ncbi:hypothetical protein ACOCIB_18950 (plasmid) [Acinetobacter baumannii]